MKYRQANPVEADRINKVAIDFLAACLYRRAKPMKMTAKRQAVADTHYVHLERLRRADGQLELTVSLRRKPEGMASSGVFVIED